jgi:hypothetical protein
VKAVTFAVLIKLSIYDAVSSKVCMILILSSDYYMFDPCGDDPSNGFGEPSNCLSTFVCYCIR